MCFSEKEKRKKEKALPAAGSVGSVREPASRGCTGLTHSWRTPPGQRESGGEGRGGTKGLLLYVCVCASFGW